MRELRRERGGYGWLATLGGAALLLLLGFGVGLMTGSLFEEPDLVAKQLSGEATDLALPPPDAAEAPADASAGHAAPPGTAPPAAGGAVAGGGSPPPAAPPGGAADFDTGAEERVPSPEAPGAAGMARVAPAPASPPPKPAPPAAAPPPPRVAAPPPAPAPPPRVGAPAASRPAPPPVSARPPGFAVQVGAFAERSAADQLVGSLRGDRFPAYVVEGAAGEGARFRVRVGPFGTRDEASAQAGRLKERRRLPTWVIREGGP